MARIKGVNRLKKSNNNDWFSEWMLSQGVSLWGAADIRALCFSIGTDGKTYPGAISWAIPMSPDIMAGIQNGPTRAYARAYTEVNVRITEIAQSLSKAIGQKGFRATPWRHHRPDAPGKYQGRLSPQNSGDTLRVRLGRHRHCQLVTRPYGPWVRLGTVFTDMPMVYGTPFNRGYCGTCRACVDACPAGALSGKRLETRDRKKRNTGCGCL